MKRKVILMSSEESFHNNYGAALQGHALYHYIANLGFDVDIVRYKGGEFTFKTKNKLIKTLVGIARKILRRSVVKPTQNISLELSEKKAKREKFFMDFQHETMTFYNEKRVNYHQLLQNIPEADYYVCGSDQIWNPFFKGGQNDLGYFLKFAPKGKRKIAYAPSFGCDDLPEKARKNLKELLQDFHSISVREESGVEIVKRYAGREAKWVLDPTMLMTPEYWKGVSRMPEGVKKPYILCYRFADSEHTKSMIDEVSDTLKMPVVSLPLSEVALKDDYNFVFDAGPREFIGLIENASLVCTDSFHATVFSVLMKTPVCVFLRESFKSGESMNARIYSFLKMVSLQDLMVSRDDTIDKMMKCLNVDYTAAHEKLAVLRNDSGNYLKNALKED